MQYHKLKNTLRQLHGIHYAKPEGTKTNANQDIFVVFAVRCQKGKDGSQVGAGQLASLGATRLAPQVVGVLIVSC